ncbi:MAG: MFS transporter [Thermaerobacter sp.]|nr:MFS transporter [Thermaerobacter sp.]
MRASDSFPHWWRWLYLDEAFVMSGAQFREVALALLMLALWPSPKSYALALVAQMLPRVALAKMWSALADRFRPRGLLVASYLVRAVGVMVVATATNVPTALMALVGMAAATGASTVAMAPYLADPDDRQVKRLVSRLRMVGSLASGIMPLAAGIALRLWGGPLGFYVSAAAYLMAGLALAQLPARPALRMGGTRAAPTKSGIMPVLRRQMAVVAAVNALMWVANILYTDYILVRLSAGPLGFGVALGLWYAAGLLAAWWLPRLNLHRVTRLVAGLILLVAAIWLVMTQPVPFWVVAVVGVPEGFATWLLTDLLQSHVLVAAPESGRSALVAAAQAWTTGGRLLGLGLAIAVPVFQHVHAGFGFLAVGAVVVAAVWLGTALMHAPPVAASRLPA